MTTAGLNDELLEAIDMTDVRHVVDVGGNHGALLAAILRRLPGATGVLFDQPHVVAGAAAALEADGVADRVDVEGGDFFEAVPPGGDLYLMADVLRNWDDEAAVRILRHCRGAMAGTARLVVCEPVGPATRSIEDWRALLAAAGLTLDRVVETAIEWSVVEATPAAPATPTNRTPTSRP